MQRFGNFGAEVPESPSAACLRRAPGPRAVEPGGKRSGPARSVVVAFCEPAQERGELPGAEVIEARPFGSDQNSRLLLEHAPNLRFELFEVSAAQSLCRGFEVLGRDAVNDLDRGGAADQ